jgi:hypothetical protein
MAFVVTFENVLLGDIPEDCDGLVEDSVHFGISFLGADKSDTESTRRSSDKLTPLRPFLRLSSMKSEINSGDFSLRLMKDSKAYAHISLVTVQQYQTNGTHLVESTLEIPIALE